MQYQFIRIFYFSTYEICALLLFFILLRKSKLNKQTRKPTSTKTCGDRPRTEEKQLVVTRQDVGTRDRGARVRGREYMRAISFIATSYGGQLVIVIKEDEPGNYIMRGSFVDRNGRPGSHTVNVAIFAVKRSTCRQAVDICTKRSSTCVCSVPGSAGCFVGV